MKFRDLDPESLQALRERLRAGDPALEPAKEAEALRRLAARLGSPRERRRRLRVAPPLAAAALVVFALALSWLYWRPREGASESGPNRAATAATAAESLGALRAGAPAAPVPDAGRDAHHLDFRPRARPLSPQSRRTP